MQQQSPAPAIILHGLHLSSLMLCAGRANRTSSCHLEGSFSKEAGWKGELLNSVELGAETEGTLRSHVSEQGN